MSCSTRQQPASRPVLSRALHTRTARDKDCMYIRTRPQLKTVVTSPDLNVLFALD
jgi:hypothetical protein